ncbi:MAG: signal peptidase II [Pseudomonadota bacterium]
MKSIDLKTLQWRGPLTAFGVAVALIIFLIDQAFKNWLLYIYQLGARGRVEITPFFDLVLTWNKGISYGLFAQSALAGQYALAAFKILVSIGLFFWLARIRDSVLALSIGLIIGGALGNALDRVVHQGVADFFSLHFRDFYWYIFNIADIAIVGGVALLLFDSFFLSGKRK